MRPTRIALGLFVALLTLTSCEGTTAPEPHETPLPATLLLEAVTPVSATGIIGEELTVAPVVRVVQGALPVEGIEVSFALSDSGAVGTATAMTDAAGLATPDTWRLGPDAGPQTLTARAAGRSLVFTADAQPGLLAAVTPVSATGIVGEELDVAPVVRVTLGDGLPVEGVRVSFVVSDSGFVRSVSVMTDSAGQASASAWRLGPAARLQTLTAHAAGHSLVFTADAQPGPITTLTVISGDHQRAAGGIPLADPLRVKATDVYGNVVAGGAVTFAVLDGGGSLEPGSSMTGSDGIAESKWTLGTPAGRQHVRAQTGDEATAQFTAEAYCEAGQCSFELAYEWLGHIMVFDGATGATRQLTNDGGSYAPAWSPDGERIAFERRGAGGGIYVMNSDGTGATRVTGPGFGSPTWSPQGDALAFSGSPTSCPGVQHCGAIYVQELSTGSVRRQVSAAGGGPVWSPDGSRIAFIHSILIGSDDHYSLRLVNLDGSGLTEIMPLTWLFTTGPTWSPDGTRMAFSQNWQIYAIRADGTGRTELTPADDPATHPMALTPAWSPDGTRIAYVRRDVGGPVPYAIMMIPADGGEPVTLVAPGYGPSWRP